jgi:6-phosphogluconate dehydrogenase (decarboxylating)
MAKTYTTPKKKAPSPAKHNSGGGGRPTASSGGAQMKILNAAATTKLTTGDDLDRNQLIALTGITGSSTVRNALAALKKKDWVEVTPEKIIVTPEGMDNADPGDVTVPASNSEYHDKMKAMFKLKAKAIAVFDMLVDSRTYEKQEVANAIFQGKTNSTFRNTLADLNKHKIVERGSGGCDSAHG